ncbi:MAG: hypothetical protein GY765_38200 [bacterium]|nr:hypothetical protein [bacterium]
MMTFNKFVRNIEKDSLVMARKWAKGIMNSKFTKTYRELPEEALVKLGKNVYENLAKWLDRDTTRIEIGKIYAEVGKQRYNEGYPLCEVIYAVNYEKRMLAQHIAATELMPDALNLYNTMNFVSKLNDFFDSACFYLIRGFQEALFKKATQMKGLDNEKMKELFPKGSFYYEPDTDTEVFEKLLEGFNLFKVK